MEQAEPRRQSEDEILRAIVEGVEAETGEGFFRSLVRQLAATLGVQYAFVSELTRERSHFRALALWARDRFGENFELPLAGTPCEAVLGGEMKHHPDCLQALFPEDKGLEEWSARSYIGVPIVDRAGLVVGHLAVVDDQPMPDGPRGMSVMRIFAARALAEIERQRVEGALRASEERLARILESATDAIVTLGEGRRIELFNAAAERIFRCSAMQAIGQRFDRFLTDELRTLLERVEREDTAQGRPRPYLGESEGLHARGADGRIFPIEVTLSRAEVGGRELHTLILRDVDERRQAEAELRALQRQNLWLRQEIQSVQGIGEIVGRSAALQKLLADLELVASTDASVLICGETGTGKELVARAIHARSARRDRPLVTVNCAALPASVVESELFGHERGAFTGAHERRIGRFELADGGTLFLDEVGELPAEMQAKLLRVLQEREFERVGGTQTLKVDVRVIAATNRDLERAVADGDFRRDLYYRLNVFPLRLPPLRERAEDIPLLVNAFVARHAQRFGRRIDGVSEATLHRLTEYPWPGNVRELENVIERAIILARGPQLEIGPEVLPAAPAPPPGPPGSRPAPRARGEGEPGDASDLESLERRHIVAMLRRSSWRVDGPYGAAKLLNLHPSTLRSRMQKLGIRRSHDADS